VLCNVQEKFRRILSDSVGDEYHLVTLWHFCYFGAIYKWSDLLTAW